MNAVERLVFIACLAYLVLATASAARNAPSNGAKTSLTCDGSIAAQFKPETQTRVLLVRAFRKGDALPNPVHQGLFDPSTKALADLCLVKLLVGPGNPGPADAPSTSAGIGIEVWLPSKDAWNGRVHAIGGGGWVGSEETDLNRISSAAAAGDARAAHTVAAEEGAVTSSTDTGHIGGDALGGSFAMNPDGTINTTLWNDFASRAIHQQVVLTKALAKAYYGSPPRYTYWDGGSTGGRQALKLAQRYPEEFDGIISAWPAITWTSFVTGGLYPQVVIQRDLGGKYMTADQLNLVSNAAIDACDVVDGRHLGFILHPEACRYDPTKDANVLCVADGGKNGTHACVTQRQALAINKIWYGITSDGSVPDPAVDNGFDPLTGKHRWYGLTRGTNLLVLVSNRAFSISADMVALELQDARLSVPSLRNAKANGADSWKSLTYEQLSRAFDAGLALQSQFGHINSDDPDLSAFRVRGAKLILFHGTNDEAIPYQGSVHYYQRVVARMGGLSEVQKFFRYYVIPGYGHSTSNGTSNPEANPPIPRPLKGEIYQLLTNWVEKEIPPENVVLQSATISQSFASGEPLERNKGGETIPAIKRSQARNAKSLPMCAYPQRIIHVGGDIFAAASYTCR